MVLCAGMLMIVLDATIVNWCCRPSSTTCASRGRAWPGWSRNHPRRRTEPPASTRPTAMRPGDPPIFDAGRASGMPGRDSRCAADRLRRSDPEDRGWPSGRAM